MWVSGQIQKRKVNVIMPDGTKRTRQGQVIYIDVENSLDPGCNQVTGAVTANAGFVHTSSCSTASPAIGGGGTATGLQNNVRYCQAQSYAFIVTAVNNNIVRISGGALGFPVL